MGEQMSRAEVIHKLNEIAVDMYHAEEFDTVKRAITLLSQQEEKQDVVSIPRRVLEGLREAAALGIVVMEHDDPRIEGKVCKDVAAEWAKAYDATTGK
jgi:hypothetical protein